MLSIQFLCHSPLRQAVNSLKRSFKGGHGVIVFSQPFIQNPLLEQQPWARQQTRRHLRLLYAQTARGSKHGSCPVQLNSINLYKICNIQYFICESRLITTLFKLLEITSLAHCRGKYKMVPTLWETLWRFFRKSKMELKYYPLIPPLGVDPRDPKSES